MHLLLLHGFGTSFRVNGRSLEIDWKSESRKESCHSVEQGPEPGRKLAVLVSVFAFVKERIRHILKFERLRYEIRSLPGFRV
jgi:hypothetical protein